MMRAGRLKHVLGVEVKTQTQDASGDPVESWTSIGGTIRGEIAPIRGREATYAGEHTIAEMDTRITVRWSPLAEQITPNHRLTHQGTIFNVVSPAHVLLGRQEIEILCKSGVNSG